ncbi:SRPBCC domain-containing protein [Pseudooceanicola sp. LIPI14-2-Ac024]|uniref:SRPBCC family protein n=1 Tax=Pseudooceanicola sp. LIPI14-2-Ac024 TaxID=3344875 RepID=UPI0035D00A65
MTETATATRTVTVERDLPHPPAKVWRALTESHLIEDWLMKTDFRPVPGHVFEMTADWGTVRCEVIEVAPQSALAYSWNAGDLASTVHWTLTETPTGTRLTMEQTGFRDDQPMYYGGAKLGWPRFFDALETVLDGME